MWENAYLSIKTSKASRAGPQLLRVRSTHNYTLLCWQLLASEAGLPLDKILDPHLTC